MKFKEGYFEFFERSLNEIFVFDPNTLQFDLANKVALRNLGFSVEEILKMTPLDLKPDLNEKVFRGMLVPLVEMAVPILTFQTRHKRKDGSLYNVDIKLEYLKTTKGHKIVAFITDITEQLLTKKQLQEQESFNRTIVESIPDIITRFDKTCRIQFISPSIENYTGLSADFFVGKKQKDLGYSIDEIKAFEKKTAEVYEKGKTVIFQSAAIKEGLPTKYYSNTMVPEFDGNGQVKTVLLISRDISELKQLEVELREKVETLHKITEELGFQNTQLQEFANITSHNLRAPAGNIQTLLSFWEQSDDQSEKEMFFEKTKQVALQLTETIEELTELANIKRTLANQKPQELELLKLANNIRNMLSVQIVEKEADVSFDFSSCPIIRFNKVFLESILLNLFTNALKYSDDRRQPIIKFSSHLVSGKPQIICEDNGLGIDLNKYGKQIFGLHKTFHKNKDSRGVGLFITKSQLETLGGRISVVSEVNKGSKFIIDLPKNSLPEQFSMRS